MYAVVTYTNMHGVRAVDRIVELCESDLTFIWLTKVQKTKSAAFKSFSDYAQPENIEYIATLQNVSGIKAKKAISK